MEGVMAADPYIAHIYLLYLQLLGKIPMTTIRPQLRALQADVKNDFQHFILQSYTIEFVAALRV